MVNMNISEKNQILLSKKIEDFYFVILQKRYIVPITTPQTSTTQIDYKVCDFFEVRGELSDKEANQIMRNNSVIQHFGVLVRLENKLYDIKQGEFVDLNKYKIVKYNPVSDYYNSKNASLLLITPDLYPQLLDEMVCLSFDDKRSYNDYKDQVLEPHYRDLTYEFLNKVGLRSRFRIRSRFNKGIKKNSN